MLSSNSRNLIIFLKRSIIYIFPILFITVVSFYFIFDNKQKYEFNVKVDFGMDIENQLIQFQINSLLFESYNYIPDVELLDIKYYRQNYIRDFRKLMANKSKCLVRVKQVSVDLENLYKLECLVTDLPPDEIEKIVLESHTLSNSKYVKLHNSYVLKVINYIDEQIDPKGFYITNIGNYEIQYKLKDTFKDWILSTFFILIALAFLVYFLCLLLLNIT